MNKSQKSKVESPRSKVCALAICAVAASAALPLRALAELPDDYLDYVQSTGSQYIDTGVNGADGLLVEAEMEWTSVPTSGWACFLGSAASDSVMYCPYQAYEATTHRMAYKNQNPAVQGGVKPLAGVRYHVVVSMDDYAQTNTIRRIEGGSMARIYTKEGTIVSDWRNLSGPVDTQRPMFIFARNLDGTADRFASARLYSLKIWQKDGNGAYQLVRHFLPCLKNSHAALFDKENEAIFLPEGGELIAGPELPRPDNLVEWVQSDGADGDRQLFIDTGIPAKVGVGMVADMEWVTKPAGYAVENIFCGATSSDSKRFWLYEAVSDEGKPNATHRFGYDNWKLQLSSNNVVAAGTRYRVEAFQAKGNQSLTVSTMAQNGTWSVFSTRANNDADVIDAQQSLFVFANNNAGMAAPIHAESRIYSLVLTNELGVLRDFIPCVADNGKAGLYDRVSERVFFPKAAADGATAEFSLATEVGAITDRTPTTKWPLSRPEWIEANGTNDFVDLGIVGQDGMRMTAEMEWLFIPASAATFCGSATSDTYLFTFYRASDNYHRIGYYNGSSTLSGGNAAPTAGIRYRVEILLDDGNQVIAVKKNENGSWVPVGNGSRTINTRFPSGAADVNLPLYLFARNLNNKPDEFAPARLYSFKLWQGDSLVRDLYPVFDPETGEPALFDKVSKKYFYNDGGYHLTAGGESSPFPGAATFWIMK